MCVLVMNNYAESPHVFLFFLIPCLFQIQTVILQLFKRSMFREGRIKGGQDSMNYVNLLIFTMLASWCLLVCSQFLISFVWFNLITMKTMKVKCKSINGSYTWAQPNNTVVIRLPGLRARFYKIMWELEPPNLRKWDGNTVTERAFQLKMTNMQTTVNIIFNWVDVCFSVVGVWK